MFTQKKHDMKKLMIITILGLLSSCGVDRSKVELTNGKGEKIEVSTLGMKKSDFDYDQFVKLASSTSSYAKRQCKNPLTYTPSYVSISEWERDSDFPNEYETKNKVVELMLSFKASNAYGVESEESVTCYFENNGGKYEDITKKINDARYGDILDGIKTQ